MVLSTVLLGVLIWAYDNYRAEHATFAWTRGVRIMLVAVVDPVTDSSDEARKGFLQRVLSGVVPTEGNVAGLARWFEEEYMRHTGKSGPPIEFIVRGPIAADRPAPSIPSAEDSFFTRWRATRAFLDYFDRIGRDEKLVFAAYDAVVFVYFYDEDEKDKYRHHHSVASRRERRGVVFTELSHARIDRACAILAHEVCHTLGATDKYEGQRSLFPHGFADPDREPPYPQDQAEIMALGIPIEPGRERVIEDLGDCVIGRRTAEEIGWR